jgi:leucyl-tRNA synthetase
MVVSPEHPLVATLTTAAQKQAVEAYISQAASKSDLERTDLAKVKTGVFTGSYAMNPVNGKRIPVWVADYVLISYGTGAIMAVPAHDERDWDFAKAFGLPIVEVLKSPVDVQQQPWTKDGLHVNSGFLDGLDKTQAISTMNDWLEKQGIGKKAVNYKIRDWIFSRQRYWGEPIPLVHCPSCGIVPVPEDQLPLTLPEVASYAPSGTGESPLVTIPEWVQTTCPHCGGPAKRETNTMPQWAGSCWYYLRYLDPHNTEQLADRSKIDYWMPVDLYVGGAEHAVLHLLYARFWHKVLYDIGIVNTDEPFMRLVNQGMITSFAYQRPDKTLVAIDEVEEQSPDVFIEKATGTRLERVVAKMSKSLKNVINPDEIIKEYGADSMRMYEMFMGPLQVSKPWATTGLSGDFRFLDRVWRLTERTVVDEIPSDDIKRLLHKTIKKVSNDTATLNFNTAISQMMILVNELYKLETLPKEVWETLILLLAPYVPHLAEELWHMMGHEGSVANVQWPAFIEEFTIDETVEVVFQINGKVRSKAQVAKGSQGLKELALANDRIAELIAGKAVVKVIVVPDKLVNIVVRD